jgi:Predicted dienelactone hydrolase
LIEAEVGKNTRFDLSKWVFKGDHKHFGTDQEIDPDGVTVPEFNNAIVIPYMAWNDPSFGNSLYIKDKKGKFVLANQFSLNELTAKGVRMISSYLNDLTTQDLPIQAPQSVEESTTIKSKPVEYEKVRRMDVKFRNRDRHTLAGRLYWPVTPGIYPGIVYCEGTFSWLDLYHWMGMHLARNGYVVLVFDPGGQGDSNGRDLGDYWLKHFPPPGWEFDIYDAITYLTRYSPIKELVDKKKIGTIGHSRGSLAVAEEQVFDERVKACVEVSMTDYFSSSKSRVPTQIQTADFDLLIGGYLNSLLYTVTNPPKQIIVVEGGSHNGFCTRKEEGAETGIYNWPMSPKWQHEISGHYALAWFDYYLKGEKSAKARITTSLKHLSKIYPSRYELG